MADALKRYWFVAAVFREPHDLVLTIADMRNNGFAAERLLVVANHRSEDTREALLGSQGAPVQVIPMHHGAAKADLSSKAPEGLRAILDALTDEARDCSAGEEAAVPREGRSQVYAQLRKDIADGAVVLIASVADPEEQLLGARILLRGNSECVLTHEIAGQNT